MRGRKPKTTQLKLLAGNPGKRALNENEPKPDLADENLKPPHWLSGEGLAVWDVEFQKLVRNRMISDTDINAFARYCQSIGRYIAAEAMVAKQGDVLIAPSGFPIQNPYLAIANKAWEMAHKAEIEFGMTPSSRTRVAANPTAKKQNRFLELVRGENKQKRA